MLSTLSDKLLFKERTVWLLNLIFWGVIYLLNISQYFFREQSEFVENGLTIAKWSIVCLFHLTAIIIASYFIALRILPLLLERAKILQGIIELIIGIYLICILSRITTVYVLEPILGGDFGRKETIFEILTDFSKLFRHYFIGIITGTLPFLCIYLLVDRQQILQKKMQIEKEKKTAELAALKSQLNPHFLFNTLNNLYSLAQQQSPLTAVSIEKLSHILDYTLYRCNEQFVPLVKEIELLNNYIALEKIRYSNRLKIETNYNCDAQYQIAPLLLLAIVENMFKHGVEKTTGMAILKIKMNTRDNLFFLTTENSFDPSGDNEQGIGLKNVQQQLELLYPNKHGLSTKQINDIFIVQLEIKLS